jgi:hypothetical protein
MERSIECTGDMECLETLGRQIKDEMRLIIEAATSQVDDGGSIITSHLMEINICFTPSHSPQLRAGSSQHGQAGSSRQTASTIPGTRDN